MRHLLYLLVLCLALLCQNIEARNPAGRVAETNDFYYNDDKEHKQAMTDGSGMGDDEDDTDGSGEDDNEDAEGSATEPTPREKTCIDKVQEVRDSGLLGAYTPQCEEDGSYSKVQCHGSIGMCWCADGKGNRVEGTQTRGAPVCENMVYSYNIVARFDIDYNTVAKNVDIYKMKIKKKLMMSFEKKFRGNTVALIINSVAPGSVVVDMDLKVSGVQANEPTTSDLKEAVRESSVGPLLDLAAEARHTTPVPTPPTPEPTKKVAKSTTTTPRDVINVLPTGEDDNDQKLSTMSTATKFSNVVPGADGSESPYQVEDDNSEEKREEETNQINFENKDGQYAASTGLLEHPGLLAGVIGGAVVGLLFAVLLVMFIVYRMRKKDEGSYALDEPKTPRLNTSYTKAPTKEFYA